MKKAVGICVCLLLCGALFAKIPVIVIDSGHGGKDAEIGSEIEPEISNGIETEIAYD
ncbi:hypothetical protein [Treponema phagedenis]|uniref:Uncharacterized protein n=1 Tax=Treponema phagedenis TaxID=162 RepID=A0A0B7GZ86_TREPH|nr:hypothetical protein [Treponema phagedenis]EFW37348.1 hypothetical protein HMPREF9554_02180 [Treponema phagedenis F0421]NVP24343.1 hypothetical protein [Treponema phagedenis]QKS91627.1 hypothetical protein HPJ96_02935 [Treponema phagedenis]QLC59847.1 hypothetical protein HW453_14340 [Treponema phagedenis]CEM62947.1 conserved exported hypothetical protein [Treponema phagedenis]